MTTTDPRQTLRDRLAAAGIPAPPPMTPDQRQVWEERLRQAHEDAAQFWARRNDKEN